MESRLGRTEWDAEGGCHLRQGLVEEVMGDDDSTHPRLETRERSLDLIPVDDERARVRDRNIRGRAELDLDDAPTPSAEDGQTGPDGDPVDPGVEPFGVAQPRQVPPRLDERILDRVARELGVPEDQTGRAVEPGDDPADEHREGVMIAFPCTLDETSLVNA